MIGLPVHVRHDPVLTYRPLGGMMIRQNKSARVLSEQNVNNLHSDSSSFSSAEVPSSMETVPCDFVDGFGSGEDEESQDNPWGRLFPIGSSFTAVGMSVSVSLHCVYTWGQGVWQWQLICGGGGQKREEVKGLF